MWVQRRKGKSSWEWMGGGLIQSWIWVYRASRRSGHRQSDLLLARATREHDEISPKKSLPEQSIVAHISNTNASEVEKQGELP